MGEIKRLIEEIKKLEEEGDRELVVARRYMGGAGTYIIGDLPCAIITLDAEDIAYLKNKYQNRLIVEMEQELDRVREDYNKLNK